MKTDDQHSHTESGQWLPKRSLGFTLVEMMVVLVVISTLSMIAAESFMRTIHMSKETHTRVEILEMVELVKIHHSDTEECVPGGDVDDFKRWLVENKFFKDIDLLDGWSNTYEIRIVCEPDLDREYIIWTSNGKDGTLGTVDDLVYLYYPPWWDEWMTHGAFK